MMKKIKEIYNKIYKALKTLYISMLATNLKPCKPQEKFSTKKVGNEKFLEMKKQRQDSVDFWERQPPPSEWDYFKNIK